VLPRKFRISRKEFSLVKKEGQRVSGPFFALLLKKGEGVKVGFIISKKIDKRATVRNKIKRRLSQALLPFLPKIRPKTHIVFLAKKVLGEKNFLEIEREVKRMLTKAKLFL